MGDEIVEKINIAFKLVDSEKHFDNLDGITDDFNEGLTDNITNLKNITELKQRELKDMKFFVDNMNKETIFWIENRKLRYDRNETHDNEDENIVYHVDFDVKDFT